MKKKVVQIISVGMALTMMLLPSGSVYASTVSDIKRQQQEDQKKLNNVQGQISGLQGQQNQVGNEIDELDANVVEIIASVDIIKEEIVEKQDQIVRTEAEYEEAKKQEEEQYASMKLRIKFMYEQGDVPYVQLLMSSSSFGDMVNKADYIEQLYEYDRKMLEEYQAIKEHVQEVWNRLEDEKAELEASKHELEEEQAYMEELLEEKKQVYENYNVQISRAKQEAAAYKTKIKQQTAQIKKLEEEARKKEEERKRAEEEERRKQEAANGGNSSGGSSNSSSSGSSTGSGSSSDSPSVSIPSSGNGSSIASYACQFIGNPYVAGGTSLTDGADCSGFVWRVFKDKGYTVPRTSWEIRNAGSGVEYSQAQPGDIICYAGHVGIYIGNGNIVHASTERTGIKITSATYKSILSVRRVA
ncbi:C40 family peptidase [Kineothrix sp. MB12-C1]|uniref:C40 family peptidase n=1 Tax=Kineothrix sp. MB12-C1 TaxID=3070215 RepID=UPI0027D21DFA|nr:C40 family peptidase [Kineothrix sp. MB12-C1]WMC94028.1 NlpC/P60 family protein [Kineothrix sp. MB12-C1]